MGDGLTYMYNPANIRNNASMDGNVTAVQSHLRCLGLSDLPVGSDPGQEKASAKLSPHFLWGLTEKTEMICTTRSYIIIKKWSRDLLIFSITNSIAYVTCALYACHAHYCTS